MNAPVISTAGEPVRDREWWDEQVENDWSAVLDSARTLTAIAVGEISMDDTFEKACREADRKAAARSVDAKTLRARRLLADDDISYERAYAEILRDRSAPEALVEALVFSLRRGVNELARSDAKRRLSGLSEGQLREVCKRLLSFRPEIATPWTPQEVEAICAIWGELK
jgi:hypothetical protein